MEKLECCPFCGSKDVRVGGSERSGAVFYFCKNCFSKGPTKSADFIAAIAWNEQLNIKPSASIIKENEHKVEKQ